MSGLLAGSQALKADALDFLDDGLITLLGLLAIGWAAVWRSRAALLQGLFLALLGLAVLAATIYRVFVLNEPAAEIMGVVGLIALAVNVASALVLLPHRGGDANVRAVWLFSRNDAIGNAAVVAAALLVAFTGNAWPDLIVAAGIAALFSTLRSRLSETRRVSCASPVPKPANLGNSYCCLGVMSCLCSVPPCGAFCCVPPIIAMFLQHGHIMPPI